MDVCYTRLFLRRTVYLIVHAVYTIQRTYIIVNNVSLYNCWITHRPRQHSSPPVNHRFRSRLHDHQHAQPVPVATHHTKSPRHRHPLHVLRTRLRHYRGGLRAGVLVGREEARCSSAVGAMSPAATFGASQAGAPSSTGGRVGHPLTSTRRRGRSKRHLWGQRASSGTVLVSRDGRASTRAACRIDTPRTSVRPSLLRARQEGGMHCRGSPKRCERDLEA